MVGFGNRFDALRPPPSGFEIESTDGEAFQLDDLDPGFRRARTSSGDAWDFTSNFVTATGATMFSPRFVRILVEH